MMSPALSPRTSRVAARAMLASLACVAGATLFGPSAAQAAVTCAWDPGTENVAIAITGTDTVTIGRTAGGLLEVTGGGIADSDCDANEADALEPTMTHVGKIVVTTPNDAAATTANAQTVVIDLADGPLAPGNNLEAVNSDPEIEFDIELGLNPTGTSDIVKIVGKPGVDVITVGAGGINLNADEAAVPDKDVLTMGGVEKIEVEGGGGADVISGAGGVDTGAAAALPLTLTGGAGNDILTGGGMNDSVVESGAPNGDDVIEGGDGNNDTVTYESRTASDPVNVSIDGVDNDGSTSGEHDNVDVENITGGAGDDTLSGTLPGAAGVGSALGNTFVGGGGINGIDTVSYAARSEGWNVTIGGAASPKTGTPETDTIDTTIDNITGSSGPDTITGDEDPNVLRGGAGPDTLSGGDGGDVLVGDAGNDTLDGGSNGALGTGDTVDYSGSTSAVTVNLTTGTATGTAIDTDAITTGTVEHVKGSPQNDVLVGDNAKNTLKGGEGDDRLTGAGEDDSQDGEGGVDTLDFTTRTGPITVDFAGSKTSGDAGAGASDTFANIELVIGSNQNDIFKSGTGNDNYDGHAGNDTADFTGISAAITANLADGTATGHGTDTFVRIENLKGGSGNDVLTGDGNANSIEGSAGNDTINGGAGNDTLDGGNNPGTPMSTPGSDTLDYSGANGAVNVNMATSTTSGAAGSDTISNFENLTGSDHADVLAGDANPNVISGGVGDDEISGGVGDDTLIGGPGNDRMSGEAGLNRVDYTGSQNPVTVDLSLGTATGEGADQLTGITNVTGSPFNDALIGDGAANELSGGDGDDLLRSAGGGSAITAEALKGGTGSDTADYATSTMPMSISLLSPASNTGDAQYDSYDSIENVTGSPQIDTITGNTNDNVLSGLAGNDVINGIDGNDTFRGGAGDDTLGSATGENGIDTVDYSTAAGPVTVDLGVSPGTATGEGSDTLNSIENATGSPSGDTLKGSATDNVLAGGGGTDTLVGGAGNDTLRGELGTDKADYSAAGAAVVVDLAVTTQQATGGAGNDTLSGIEDLVGSANNDTLSGDGNANAIEGGGGDDIVNGRAGNDVLTGGTGTNTLSYAGVAGGVTVDLGQTTAQATGAGGSDTISDFQNVTGSSFNDILIGTVGDNAIDGGANVVGGDTVSYDTAPAGVTVDLAVTAAQPTGGAGNDTITNVENVTGSGFSDTIAGTSGDNVLDGGANSSGGGDTLSYAAATAGVFVNLGDSSPQDTEGAGTDTISDFENIDGSGHGDGLTGNAGANTMNGNGGDDFIDGAGGADTENGGAGADRFDQGSAPNGGDTMAGGSGIDTVIYDLRSGAVSVTRNDAPDDGESGEGDNVGSDIEAETLPTTAATAPRNVSATAGNRSATVTWAAPLDNGRSDITGYKVTASPGGATASTAGDQRSAVVGGLTNGTSYTFTVVATNARGNSPASAPSNAVVPKAADGTTGTQGYTMVDAGGAVFNFGTSKFFGSMAGHALNSPMIGIANTPTGNGYWMVARDGGIFSFGDAKFYGSMGGMTLNSPVLGMEPTPTGKGYWLFAGDGGIFSFGDATFFGSMGGRPLNSPVVGMASTSTGKGYWLVAGDGGIFSFGDAKFFGSMGGHKLNQPVFDIAAGPGDKGYWLVARDGGMFTFGNIGFFGSAAPSRPATVIGMGASPTGNGYWIADERGVVFNFGDAEALGDFRNAPRSVVGFAPMPKR